MNIEESVKIATCEKNKCYMVSAKYNPDFGTKKTIIKTSHIIHEDRKVVEHKKRFWKKFGCQYSVKQFNKVIPIEELRIGDVIMVLEPEYPDRFINGLYELEVLKK